VTGTVSYGRATVTFLSVTPGDTADELGTYPMIKTGVDVPGCLHQPVKDTTTGSGLGGLRREFEEIGSSIATQWWRTTAPPVAAALAAQASDFLRVGGADYQIVGQPVHFEDFKGRVVKVTILSERQVIGH
jgi:hypothetical protein